MQRPCGRYLARTENKEGKENVRREHRTKPESPWKGGGVMCRAWWVQARTLDITPPAVEALQGVYKGELGLYISLLHGLICCNLLSILSAARNKISDQKGLRQVPFLPNKKPRDRHFQDWFSCLAMSRLWVSIFEILGLFPHGHKTAAAVPGIICLPHGKEKKKTSRNLSSEIKRRKVSS